MNLVRRKTICLLLALSMSIMPSMALAVQSPGDQAANGDLAYIIPEATVAGVAYPQRVLTRPEMQMMPLEVLTAAGVKEFGIDPMDIEQVTVMVVPPSPMPCYGIVVRFSKAYELKNILQNAKRTTVETQIDGRLYLKHVSPLAPGFFMPDDHTLLIANDSGLKKMLANHISPVIGPARRLLKSVDKSSDLAIVAAIKPMRPLIEPMLNAQKIPPPFAGLKQVPGLLSAARLQIQARPDGSISLALLGNDEAAAKEIESQLNQLIDMGQAVMKAQMTEQFEDSDDPVQQAMGRYLQRVSGNMFAPLRPTRKGKVVKLSLSVERHGQIATTGVLIALLLPAVQAAREAARRAASTNNLKHIALAMHIHHDTYKRFPDRAIFDKNGKPLLSWRVKILPFIEETNLYKQFHLDEPWDSDHNKKLIPLMPAIYRNPSSTAEQGKTDYLVPTGKGSIFEKQKAARFGDIIDGTSNTIMVVEVDPARAVTWTKPEDLNYNEKDLTAGLGKAHPGGFLATLADGSVKFISIGIDHKLFLNLLQMNDRHVINHNNF